MNFTPVQVASRKELDMRPGDTVRVFQKIQEKDKTRLQAFEGMVIARKHGTEPGATFTVRRTTGGFGVEKIFPLYSPNIDRIEITKRSKVRRGKLYFIREKALKQASKRLKMMFVDIKTEEVAEADDLTQIEGIGPKIAEVLVAGGITTFAQLADAKDEDVQAMIADVPGNHQAGTWNEQAALARDGKWDELKELQDKLIGGVEVAEESAPAEEAPAEEEK